MRGLRIVPFEERHLSPVVAIEKLVHSAPWSEISFRNELANDIGRFLVAESGEEVVGYGGVWYVVDEAHIVNVAVHPAWRRQGIGRKLVIDLLEGARGAGMACSTLEVRAGNEAAQRLYENLGFHATAVRKRYYPDNREDAVIMWLARLGEWRTPGS